MKKSRLLGAVCAAVFSFISMQSHAAPIYGQGTWETTLEGRDLDGDQNTAEAYYDTVLNITWLADANPYGTYLNWGSTNAWVSALDLGPGMDNWRLPTMIDINNDGCNFAYTGTDCGYNVLTTNGPTVYSELASMFYDTLGNKAWHDTSGAYPQPGHDIFNTGLFENLVDVACFEPSGICGGVYYWSGLQYAPDSGFNWAFGYGGGRQTGKFNGDWGGGWAVHDGDIGAAIVPIPAALWLFGSGLLGLIGVARKKSA